MNDNFIIDFTGKFDCMCSIEKVSFECSITPKSVKMKCQNCPRVYFYRRTIIG